MRSADPDFVASISSANNLIQASIISYESIVDFLERDSCFSCFANLLDRRHFHKRFACCRRFRRIVGPERDKVHIVRESCGHPTASRRLSFPKKKIIRNDEW